MSYLLSTLLILVVVTMVSAVLIAKLTTVLAARAQVDTPNHRSLHVGSVPRGGGLVIALMIIAVLLWSAWVSVTPWLFLSLACLLAAWTLLGWQDDVHDLTTRFRFAAQFLLSFATVCTLGWINQLELSPNFALPLGWLGIPLTVVGMVWLANLYNFMDGMDGLAGSQAIVAAITLAFWFGMQGSNELALVCAIAAAASYGFLWHNWSPASIFMGDVGSISLGAFFALMLIIGANRFDIPVLSTVILLFAFIGDTTITFVWRLLKRENLGEAHNSHFYQRLARAGHSHRQVVVLYIAYMVFCAVAASISIIMPELLLTIFVSLALTTLLLAAFIVLYTKERLQAQ